MCDDSGWPDLSFWLGLAQSGQPRRVKLKRHVEVGDEVVSRTGLGQDGVECQPVGVR